MRLLLPLLLLASPVSPISPVSPAAPPPVAPVAAIATGATGAAVEPVRFASSAFGARVELEVRGLARPAAEAAIQDALREITTVERMTDPAAVGGGVARLNAAAGAGPQPVEPALLKLLQRTLEFCFWTEGAQGPLGRDLYRLWGLRTPATALPSDAALQAASTAASCSGLRYDPQKVTATLAAGAGLELWGFALGEAVDRAVDALKRHRVPSGFVQVGGVRRGFGGGPNGKGWRTVMPVFDGLDQPLGEIWLRDQSFAVASANQNALRIGGEVYAPYLNQRNGKPSTGVLAALAASELAVDAQALSVLGMVISPHEAQLRIGSLRPQPSLLWVLGTGQGSPLLVEYRWSVLPKK